MAPCDADGVKVEVMMSAEKQKIFIVEDEVLVAFEMTDTLEDMGFEVVGPSVHLEEAKKKAETAEIDIAFLDVNLGKGKTSEPIAKILKERSIPFVFITAYDRDQVEFVSAEDKLVKKPVSGHELLNVLKQILPTLSE